MEAVAKHDFLATAEDELNFSKGQKLKVINTAEDLNWFKAELNGRQGLVPSNYIEMKPANWYVGQVSRSEAEQMLLERNENHQFTQRDGAFLVRNSESNSGGSESQFSISVKFGNEVQHFRVLRDGTKFYLWQSRFETLNELIRHHRTNSISRSHTLLLQDMCRPKVIANYDFHPENSAEELEMKRGDIVVVLNKNDPNWWMGEITRGSQTLRGLFPKTYVSSYTD